MKFYRHSDMLRAVLPLALSLFLLCGCAAPGQKSPSEPDSTGAPRPTVDWKTQGFRTSDSMEEEPSLWVSGFQKLSWEPELKDTETLGWPLGEAQVFGDKLYRFLTVDRKEKDGRTDARWVLECCDAQTGEASLTPVSREDLGLGDGPWQTQERTRRLADAAVIAPGSYVFLYAEDEKTEEGYHVDTLDLIYTDLQGSCRRVSMFDAYLENGILEMLYRQLGEYMEKPIGTSYFPPLLRCDGKGNTYYMAGYTQYGYAKLLAFDPEGTLLFLYKSSEQRSLQDSFRTQDGEMLIVMNNFREKKYGFFRADTEKKDLWEAGEISIRSGVFAGVYGLWGNELYYKTEKSMVCWDIENGGCSVTLSFEENSLSPYSTMQMLVREGGEPVLWMETDRGEQYLAALAAEKNTELPNIRVSNIYAADSSVLEAGTEISYNCVRTANAVPGVLYSYEAKEDTEAFRTRVLAELAAGEGPDILFVSREDMVMLQEKGLLADLAELVPEGFLQKIYPGVKELGTVNGQYAGITAGIYTESIAVSRDLWDKDTWTFEDMLRLMEEGKLQPLVGNSYWGGGITDKHPYCYPLSTRKILLISQLDNPAFIDRKTEECHVKDGWLQRFLELTNVKPDDLEYDGESLLNGGKMMRAISLGSGLRLSEFDVRISGENGHYAGLPTDGACGNYIYDRGFVVVNRNSAYPEHVRAYLSCLLEDEYLKKADVPIIRSAPEDVTMDKEGNVWWMEENPALKEQLKVFEDGSTSLERAEKFLESCVAAPFVDPQLVVILEEELSTLEEGGRTIEQTVEILSNRIQLYLDENR